MACPEFWLMSSAIPLILESASQSQARRRDSAPITSASLPGPAHLTRSAPEMGASSNGAARSAPEPRSGEPSLAPGVSRGMGRTRKIASPVRGDTTPPAHVLAIEVSVAPTRARILVGRLITTAHAVAYESIAATRLRRSVIRWLSGDCSPCGVEFVRSCDDACIGAVWLRGDEFVRICRSSRC